MSCEGCANRLDGSCKGLGTCGGHQQSADDGLRVQLVQALPPDPQALFAKPGTQVLFAVQQPAAQLAGPHLSRH